MTSTDQSETSEVPESANFLLSGSSPAEPQEEAIDFTGFLTAIHSCASWTSIRNLILPWSDVAKKKKKKWKEDWATFVLTRRVCCRLLAALFFRFQLPQTPLPTRVTWISQNRLSSTIFFLPFFFISWTLLICDCFDRIPVRCDFVLNK